MKVVIGSLLILVSLASIVFAQSPGYIVGETQYYMQSNGSSGHRIALGTDDAVHFTWMNGNQSTRQIYYNYVTSRDVWLGQVPVSML